MTILFFNTFYYPKQVGGAEVSVQHLAERLAKSGNKVYVITTGNRISVERFHGVIIIRIKQQNIFSTYDDFQNSALRKSIWHLVDSCNPLNFLLISSLLKRIKPHVVHTNNIQGFSPFIWLIIKKHQLPLVHTLRDYYLLCHKTTLYQNEQTCNNLCWQCKITHTIKRNFTGYPDSYIGVSNFILKKHASCFSVKQKAKVIYNVVNGPGEVPARETNGKKLVFGFIGRISQAKGAEYLAKELANVKNELKDHFKLILAGNGDEELVGRMRRELNGLDFEFMGFVNPERFYKQIDVLIVPSMWNEPFGKIVLESLSYAVPVCLARSGGLKELHNPECTWSFAPRQDELGKMIAYILANKSEISVKRQFCRVHANRFSQKYHDQEYLNMYTSCV